MSLSLESVSISIGGRQLVRSVDLTLNPGEVVGLLGPNGASGPRRSISSSVYCDPMPARFASMDVM